MPELVDADIFAAERQLPERAEGFKGDNKAIHSHLVLVSDAV